MMFTFLKRIMIIFTLKAIIKYIFTRLKEASTWRSLIYFLGGTLAIKYPQVAETLIQYALITAGFLGVVLPDSMGTYLGNKIDHALSTEPEPVEPVEEQCMPMIDESYARPNQTATTVTNNPDTVNSVVPVIMAAVATASAEFTTIANNEVVHEQINSSSPDAPFSSGFGDM